MARPSDWSPVDMDRDPTPGNPDEVRELADDLQTFADDVGEALGRIRGMAEDRAVMDWAGLSAEAFRSEFDGVPGNLEKLQTSYDMAAQALQTYWPKLETAQGMADRALDRAIAAQADLSSAQAALTDAQDWVSRAGDEAERLEREGERENVEPPSEAEVRAATRDATAANEAASSAQSRVDAAEEALSAARQLALDAKEMREEAARTCASEIDAASDAGIQNRRWWEDAIHWVSENWDTIVEICKVVVAVLGIVVMIIGGPLAWVVLAAALVVLADTLYDYANGRASLWDVAFAALDCIPGMKGLTTLGGLARGMRSLATTGLRGLRAGALRLGRNLRMTGIRGGDRLACGDPVDMATGEVVMSAVDVEIPGVLPLRLSRQHVSSRPSGVWLGGAWSSTLDQRLVLESGGVRLFTEDGMILDYPVPLDDPDHPVLPVEGPRWGLSWNGEAHGTLSVTQVESGRTLHFRPSAGRPGTELPLAAISDRNGNTISVLRDSHGTPTEIRHSAGHTIGVTTEDGLVIGLSLLSDPGRPTLIRYGYDTAGNLTEIHRPLADRPLRLRYDDSSRLTGWEDTNGNWYRYVYDAEGRCVATEGVDSILNSAISYDPERNRTVYVDSLGHPTVFQFNDCYQLVEETNALGHSTTRTWDRYDRPLSITDALGRTTRYAYGDDGTVTIIRPDGTTSVIECDGMEQPTRITEADGSLWQRGHDDRGELVSTVDPTGAVTRYVRDDLGHLVRMTDALGRVREIVPDPAGQPLRISEEGAEARYAYDAMGRIVEIVDPAGKSNRFRWSTSGHLLQHDHPDGTSDHYTYDGEGNLVEHVDATGAVTRFEYGHLDRMTVRTNPDGGRFTFRYDTECRPVAITNPAGETWSYDYDPAGNVVAETDFAGITTRYERDAAGQLITRTNAEGQWVRFTHDAMGRVVSSRSGDQETTFDYDALGRLVRAANTDAVLVMEYDGANRLIAETCNGRTLRSAYDQVGRRLERVTPGGMASAWRYGPGRLPLALDFAGHSVRFSFDAARREIGREVDGTRLVSRSWDDRNRITAQLLHDVGGRERRRDYAYRADGRLTAMTDSEYGQQAMELDPMGRVTVVRTPAGTESYAYDRAGTLVRGGPRTSTTHDRRGRVVRRVRKLLSGGSRTWAYVWDAEDRLTEVTTPDGTRWRYLYDPMGRRIAKLRLGDDGETAERTDFVWDGSRLVECHTEQGVVGWEYMPDSHRPLCQAERRQLSQDEVDRRFYAIVTDQIGTPTELLTPGGEVAWHQPFTLWGAAAGPATGTADCPLRFPGQFFDRETGLHYNLRRYYDPESARYCSPDPIGLAGGPDNRNYVPNPQSQCDPWGLSPPDCMAAALRQAQADALRHNAAGGPSISRIAVARIRGTDMVATGFSGPAGRPSYMEQELADALRNGGQMDWDAANCAEIRAVNALIGEFGADMNHLGDTANMFQEIEFLTLRLDGVPDAACLSCQSVLVANGASDLAPGLNAINWSL
ncbi:DUF6531 domain-containing protein [Streptomyces millisiae]|uniref:RHS repeat-associated core domain-containing protein n=1 Tax=Streptomyces millisiae TaxID=3075542 RepID=A0ABU2LWX2_9ACTN|nr:DUF6531 domain-containing protein [Streptomyces sp. DSM 44918]MDT0321783.1 RHS repeat-associated core domain-containing protein [Streptomyces sp. DSM 44918]